jgi:hypothetical protein
MWILIEWGIEKDDKDVILACIKPEVLLERAWLAVRDTGKDPDQREIDSDTYEVWEKEGRIRYTVERIRQIW